MLVKADGTNYHVHVGNQLRSVKQDLVIGAGS